MNKTELKAGDIYVKNDYPYSKFEIVAVAQGIVGKFATENTFVIYKESNIPNAPCPKFWCRCSIEFLDLFRPYNSEIEYYKNQLQQALDTVKDLQLKICALQ